MQVKRWTPARKLFLVCLTVFLFPLLIISSLVDKNTLFRSLNFYHSHALDIFFEWFTCLGDGLFAVFITIVLLISKKITLAVKVLGSFLLSGLLVQVLKRVFEMPRPLAVLGKSLYPYFIEGVTHSGLTSFPSGHTTTAFAMAVTITWNMPGKKWSISLFFLAWMVAYSRVYLGQHYLGDVTAGALVGSGIAYFIEYLFTLFAGKNKGIRVA